MNDDIHYLQGNETILEELYHILSTFLVSKTQLVLTSDRPFPELKQFLEILKSHYELCLEVYLHKRGYGI
jgi:chromosomal replication initiation ATPase DnaA